jgi:hypothetical protein
MVVMCHSTVERATVDTPFFGPEISQDQRSFTFLGQLGTTSGLRDRSRKQTFEGNEWVGPTALHVANNRALAAEGASLGRHLRQLEELKQPIAWSFGCRSAGCLRPEPSADTERMVEHAH